MNQRANARAASLERCKRMAQSPSHPPSPLPLFLSLPLTSLISFIFLSDSLFCSHSFLLPLKLLLTSHIHHHRYVHIPLLPWHIYSLLSLFDSIIPPPVLLSCLFISFFAHFVSVIPFCVALAGAIISIFLPPRSDSSFPWALSPPSDSLSSLIVFKERGKKEKKEEKKELKRDEDRGRKKKRASIRERRGRRVKEERLKAHYFPPDGRKWVRGQ